MERTRPCPPGVAEGGSGDARCRRERERRPDANLSIPEGRACQHLSDMFLGRTYYLR
ncbi:MAG TPA: hypothetical protein VED59_05650 [Acidimicrobiales bacterium]|nr:hypothetical protein [Acidimicrobiales bacterium]